MILSASEGKPRKRTRLHRDAGLTCHHLTRMLLVTHIPIRLSFLSKSSPWNGKRPLCNFHFLSFDKETFYSYIYFLQTYYDLEHGSDVITGLERYLTSCFISNPVGFAGTAGGLVSLLTCKSKVHFIAKIHCIK